VVSTPRRTLLERSPDGVIVAAAGGRANEGKSFGQIATTLRGSAANAFEKQDSLIGEPKVLGEGNLVSLASSNESVEDGSELLHSFRRRRAASFTREALNLLSNTP
jgi:hypothetical protein